MAEQGLKNRVRLVEAMVDALVTGRHGAIPVEQLRSWSGSPRKGTPEAFAEFLLHDLARWGNIDEVDADLDKL